MDQKPHELNDDEQIDDAIDRNSAQIRSNRAKPRPAKANAPLANLKRLSRGTYLEKELLLSVAYRSLTIPAAYQVYAIFRLKLVFPRGSNKGGDYKQATNYRELQFTYLEAEKEYGLTGGVFGRALKDTHRVGIIDVTKTGTGQHKNLSLYGFTRCHAQLLLAEFNLQPKNRTLRYRQTKMEILQCVRK